MIVYHGSEKILKKPEYGKGRTSNDYGRGFYCTENIELAKEWACGNGNNGYANIYDFDDNGLRILDLNSKQYSILNWLALLADNRTYWENGAISEQAKSYFHDNFLIDISPYDVIKGYRADDSYFSFARDFVAGTISLKKLSNAMHLGKLGEQIVLKSRKAFDAIRFTGFEEASAEQYFKKKRKRDLEARREYRKTKVASDSVNDIFMIDIIREGIKNGDPRLQ